VREPPSNQIQQGEQKNPHNINEMPVKAGYLDGVEVFLEAIPRGQHDQGCHDAAAHDHMQSVKPGHEKIEEHEKLDVSGMRTVISEVNTGGETVKILVPPLLAKLDSKKHESENQSHHQKRDQGLLFPKLRGPDAHCHRQAAANEDSGIGCTPNNVEVMATNLERRQVPVTVNGIAGKQAAKEKDFGRQKNPHAQAGSLVLLQLVVKLFREESSFRFSQLFPPSNQ
jgi:hypothetical protein